MKNSASGPQYDVVAMPVVFRYSSALNAMNRGSREYGSRVMRVVDVAGERERRHLQHRIHERASTTSGQQQHVALVDRLEAADGRAVEAQPLAEHVLVQRRRRDGEVLPGAGQVAELHVHDLDASGRG